MVKKAVLLPPDERMDEVEYYDVGDEPVEVKTDYEKKLDSLLESMNSDEEAMMSVYRQRGSGKESMSFLDSFPADKYTHPEILMFLKNTYGTGDYRVQVRINGRLRINKLLCVEAPIKDDDNTGGNSLSGVSELLNTLMARQDQLFSQMNNKVESESDIISKMMLYKELFSGASAPQVNPMSQLTETLGVLEAMGVSIGGGGGEDDGFGSLIDKLTPLITYGMNEQNQPTQPQPQPQPQQKRRNNPQQSEASKMRMMQNIKIKMGLQYLLTAAVAGNKPEEYAQNVIDQVGEKEIGGLFGNPEYMNYLIKILPDIERYKEWFTTLALEINKCMSDTPNHGQDKVHTKDDT